MCDTCSPGTIQLPGYVSAERVCVPCENAVKALREWIQGESVAMTGNMNANIHGDRVRYWPEKGDAQGTAEVWLSESLMMVMWAIEEKVQGAPIFDLLRVETGFSTPGVSN